MLGEMPQRTQSPLSIDWHKAFHSYTSLFATQTNEIQVQATLTLARLAKHAPHPIITNTIPILIDLLAAPCPNLQQAAAHALSQLARHPDSPLCPIIGQSGAIQSILRLIPTSKDGFLLTLLRCISALVAFNNPNRIILARNGGLEIIIGLLSVPADETKRYLLEILTALSLLREVRRVIVGHGGLPFLVQALSYGKNLSRIQAAQAIGLLGISKTVRHLLVELGVIPGLIGLLRDGDVSARITSGNALGIISSHMAHLRLVAQAGAIPLYAELMEGPEQTGKEIAEDVFCVLAVLVENAVLIMEQLVRILQGNNEEAKASAIDVIGDLSGYKHSGPVMRQSGAVRLLLELLRDGNGDIRMKASGAVAQLSYDGANRRNLVDEGVIPVLFYLLRGDSEELRDYAAEAVINFAEDPLFQEQVSEAFEKQSFLDIQERLSRIRASDGRITRSMRLMRVGQLTSDLGIF